jgi:hypothetical protein
MAKKTAALKSETAIKSETVKLTPAANGGNEAVTYEFTIEEGKRISAEIDLATDKVESLQMERALVYVRGRKSGVIGSEPVHAQAWLSAVHPKLSPDTVKTQAGALRTWAEPEVVAANLDYPALLAAFAALPKKERGDKSPFNAVQSVNTAAKRAAKDKTALPDLTAVDNLKAIVAKKVVPVAAVVAVTPPPVKTPEEVAADKLRETRAAFVADTMALIELDSTIEEKIKKQLLAFCKRFS